MKATELTLRKLRKAKNIGITLNDFPTGFRLGARIKDLRDDGYDILTDKIIDHSAGYKRSISRYTLIRNNASDRA